MLVSCESVKTRDGISHNTAETWSWNYIIHLDLCRNSKGASLMILLYLLLILLSHVSANNKLAADRSVTILNINFENATLDAKSSEQFWVSKQLIFFASVEIALAMPTSPNFNQRHSRSS